MTEKRFIYTTRIITDKKGYCKDYIWDNETLLHTAQIVGILNAQDEEIKELEKENDTLRMVTGKELFKEIDNLKEDIQQLEKENSEAHDLNILASRFIIEKGLAKEFLEWSKEND